MENIKTFKTVNYIIELVIPDTSKDLKGSKENNINVYDENGIFLWNISELLKNYSDKFCINKLAVSLDVAFNVAFIVPSS